MIVLFLHEILRLEEGCVSGNLSGEICENVDEVADIVSHLRVKAEEGAAEAVIAPTGFAVGLVSTAMLLLFTAIFITTLDLGTGATPYTMQEWAWAAQ